MRWIRISLAAKYRILFGLAVLLIIGAALAVPWWRMELLVLGQPYHEAQRIAEDYFQLVLPDPTSPAATGHSVHSREFGLLPPERQHEQVQFVRWPKTLEDVSPEEATSPRGAFVDKAFRTFISNPSQTSVYLDEQVGGSRRFLYAHAVRVSKRCLSCHAENKTAQPFQENQLAGVITVDLPADLGSEGALLNRIAVIAAGLLAGTLAILVFYVITQRFILAPIQELRQVTIRVSEGDLEVRSGVQTGDEFEHLSENLNDMLEKLRTQQEELKRANRLLDEKLGEMAESNVALYEANRVKSEFLANVSHELRTPLTTIIGFAELLREGDHFKANEKAARYAENILISGRILLEIINDLLDLAKIEAGKVELRREPVDVVSLGRDLVDFTRPLAEKKELDLRLDAADDVPVVQTDESRLRQILFNLLSNAIKFTPAGGRVRMNFRRLGDEEVELNVEDTGPGVAREEHERIFEKFRQIDQSATREYPGTGLGLAIAKELTLLLGGRIGIESEIGRGARFWVRLPVAADAVPEQPAISLLR